MAFFSGRMNGRYEWLNEWLFECYLIAFFIMETYRIVRSYAPSLNKRSRVIKRGLTLEEAQQHCRDPKTRKAGEWFDGYDLDH